MLRTLLPRAFRLPLIVLAALVVLWVALLQLEHTGAGPAGNLHATNAASQQGQQASAPGQANADAHNVKHCTDGKGHDAEHNKHCRGISHA